MTVGAFSFAQSSTGDGIPDLVKYALGLSSNFPSLSGATTPTVSTFNGTGYLTMSIARFLPPSDATLSIEVSGDLLTWLPAAVITSTPSVLQVRDPVPADGAGGRFMRVKVTRP